MIVRVHKTKDYTVMSNFHLRDKQLSLKAKGLLSVMLSLPENWDYSISGLVAILKDGKSAVMNALDELKECKYLRMTQVAENGKFAGFDYDIYEEPYSEKPYSENPHTEKPHTEKPPQYNTDESIIKETNTESTNILSEVVEYLNFKTGKRFTDTNAITKRLVKARLSDGYTMEDFKRVIDKKCADWRGTAFEIYLRPETLFGTKFDGYLNEKKAETNIYDERLPI